MPSTQSVQEQPRRKTRDVPMQGTAQVDGYNYKVDDAGEYLVLSRTVKTGTQRPKSVQVETPVPGHPERRRWWIFLFTLGLAGACLVAYVLPML